MATAQHNLTDVRHAFLADRLGEIRAEQNQLKTEWNSIVDQLKDEGVDVVEGNAYRVTISYYIATSRINWQAVAKKLEPSRQLIQAHTSVGHSDRVTVKALSK